MKNTRIIFAVAAMFVFAACAEHSITPDGQQKQIFISPIAGMSTKAPVTGTVFSENYDMMVSAYYNAVNTSESGEYFTGVQFGKASDNLWHAGSPKYWPLQGTLNFLAYADSTLKAGSNIVTAATWTNNVPAQQMKLTVGDNSAVRDDLLYGAANNQVFQASGTPIEFKHAGALLVFKFRVSNDAFNYNATDNTGVKLTGLTISDLYFGGELNVNNSTDAATGLTAAWSNLSSKKTTANVTDKDGNYYAPASLPTTFTTEGLGNAYTIIPQQARTTFTIYYELYNGKDSSDENIPAKSMSYTYNCVLSPAEDWLMGKKYIYEITFNLREITINPTVTDWETAASYTVTIQ